MRYLGRSLALGLIAATALGLDARAATTTKKTTLGITVAVVSNCNITGGTIDFGTYTIGQTTDLVGEGGLDYTGCAGATPTVELDGGREGNVSARKMSNGANRLPYQLYADSSRKTIWGTGTAARGPSTLNANGAGTLTVWGKIAGSQSVPAGTYTDTIAVTMTF